MMKYTTCLLIFLPLIVNAQSDTLKINQLLNTWHKAAAIADTDVFFGTMADDAIYIGTDKTERWDKKSFQDFAKPYFDRGKAWDFKPYDRQILLGPNGNTAWFSELLETWMGVCRGSGVMVKENGQWKLKQYHLSVTVPNEIIQNFIQLINSYEESQNNDK